MKTVVILALLCIDVAFSDTFKVSVTGRTVCNGQPMSATVELLEYDFISSDDVLGKTVSDQQGQFRVAGQESEMFTIHPYLRITHTCNAKPNCQRVSKFEVIQGALGGVYHMFDIALQSNFLADKC